MAMAVTRFAGEYALLAAWTGESEEQLRADQDLHSDDREHWLAWDGGHLAGVLHPWRSPDGQLHLYFGKCRTNAYAPLAAAVAGPCRTMLNTAETDAIEALTQAGFTERRRENLYEIPVAHIEAPAPPGLDIITADQTALEPLMLLDCAIRADIPGTEGWQPDPVWFREETYDSPFFDPQTYRVALDGSRYVGLARIWKPSPDERYGTLGCIGVLPPYRRRGLARALIAQAMAPLARAGAPIVTAEADTTNTASHTLLTSFGAEITGTTVELHRTV